jgi:tetratricopeptide (TPR) repeat protein
MVASAASSADRWPADTGTGGQGELAGEEGVFRREVLRLGGSLAASSAVSGPVARIAATLTSYPSWAAGSPLARSAVSVGELAAEVAHTKRDYQACRYWLVLDMLPGLLESARLACDTASGDDLLRAFALAADAYQVTGSVLLKLDDLGLAALAADRSVEAAIRSQDPVALAASARIVTHSLMASGHQQRAREIASHAAARMAAEVRNPGPETLSVYGALVLRGAVAAALGEDRAEALGMLDEAGDAAQRLGRDDNAYWTAFGPTNVAQHRVHVAMVLGDAGTAIDLARRIDMNQIPIAERKASLFIDTAQAFVQWDKHEQAYQALRAADRVAPEEVRARRVVHSLAAELATRAPRTIRAQAREFAEQIGALA